jgi:hypothetical protein
VLYFPDIILFLADSGVTELIPGASILKKKLCEIRVDMIHHISVICPSSVVSFGRVSRASSGYSMDRGLFFSCSCSESIGI